MSKVPFQIAAKRLEINKNVKRARFVRHFSDLIYALNSRPSFAEAPNEWTQIEHNMRGRRTAWSPLWWWSCFYYYLGCYSSLQHLNLTRGIMWQFINSNWRHMLLPVGYKLPYHMNLSRLSRRFSITAQPISKHKGWHVWKETLQFLGFVVSLYVFRHTCIFSSSIQLGCDHIMSLSEVEWRRVSHSLAVWSGFLVFWW